MEPFDITVDILELDGEEFIVVSHALDEGEVPDGIEALPAAMRAVAVLALAGCDNADIARVRGTSVRTVAKQLETIYRRLHVGSRRELMARFGSSSLGRR
jgi:DNA-binding NarL/FixJ family response regulator